MKVKDIFENLLLKQGIESYGHVIQDERLRDTVANMMLAKAKMDSDDFDNYSETEITKEEYLKNLDVQDFKLYNNKKHTER